MIDYEKHKLELPNIAQAYTVAKDSDGYMQFELMDGGSFTLYPTEFYDAFQLLFSEEFAEFVRCVNRKNERECEYRNEFNYVAKIAQSEIPISTTTLYDVTHLAKAYGVWSGKCSQIKETIIDRVSWNTWIDTCRLYEVFTGCQREWLD